MSKFNRFGNMFASLEVMKRSYALAEVPFKIAGNLYFVGNTWCSMHLIDTGEGLVLLDTPCINELPYLVDSVYRLGFKLRDVKHIFVSHAHLDHYGSVMALVHLTGAKTYMGELEVKDMEERSEYFYNIAKYGGGKGDTGFNEPFKADVVVKDEDIITIGNTSFRWVLSPGHTNGCMSHFWDLTDDDGKIYKVGIYGGAGYGSMSLARLKQRNLPESYQQVYYDSIARVWNEHVDIMLGNHPFHNDTFEKYERREAGEPNPFIDPTEWQRYLKEMRDGYTEFLKLDDEGIDEMYEHSGMYDFRPVLAEREKKVQEK